MQERLGLSGLDTLRFSDLHKAYLGLSGRTFQQTLQAKTSTKIDLVDGEGRTTLSWASEHGNHKAVACLLERGASPNAADFHGQTPLHFAAHGGHFECVSSLLSSGADIDAETHHGTTALGLSAFHADAHNATRILLLNGANVNHADDTKSQPLNSAAAKGSPETVSLLLRQGAEINAQNDDGNTPLLQAMHSSNHDTLKYLLDQADVEIHHLCHQPSRFFSGHENILQVLVGYCDYEALRLFSDARTRLAAKHRWPLQDIEDAIFEAETKLGDPEDEDYPLGHCQLGADPLEWLALFKDFARSMMIEDRSGYEQNPDPSKGVDPSSMTDHDDDVNDDTGSVTMSGGLSVQAGHEETETEDWADAVEFI